MSASLSESNSVAMAMFDSYSKTVMRNLSRGEIAKINKRTYHEIGGTEVMKYVTETYGKEDTYPSRRGRQTQGKISEEHIKARISVHIREII